MLNMVPLGLMVSDKKIFKDFHKKISFWRNQILSWNSEEDYGSNISVKFHQNPKSSLREEDV